MHDKAYPITTLGLTQAWALLWQYLNLPISIKRYTDYDFPREEISTTRKFLQGTSKLSQLNEN